MNTASQLSLGDRFEILEPSGGVWIVTRLVNTIGPFPHVSIIRESNPDETRLLALSVLTDKTRYKRVPISTDLGE